MAESMNDQRLSGGTEYHADDPTTTEREQRQQEPTGSPPVSASGTASGSDGTPTTYGRTVTGSGSTTTGTTNTTVDAGAATGGMGSTETDPGGSTTLGEGDSLAAGAGGDLQAMGNAVKSADAQQVDDTSS